MRTEGKHTVHEEDEEAVVLTEPHDEECETITQEASPKTSSPNHNCLPENEASRPTSTPSRSTSSPTTPAPHPVSELDTTKPSTTSSYKRPSAFSRKFASPVIVTHPRRPFTKPLPRNLDPKSTVTLLLSNSLQQKYGKTKGQKFFQTPFSQSRYHADGAPGSSAAGARDMKLRGRDKEKELWRKKFHYFSGEEQQKSLESGEEAGKAKHSAEELAKIQSRVRESLRAQGVVSHSVMHVLCM